jgi:hypothetical protein
MVAFVATLAANRNTPIEDTGLVKKRGGQGRGRGGATEIDHQAIPISYVVFDILVL